MNVDEMKVSGIIKYAISIAVAAVLLYFSFKGIDWERFSSGFAGCAHTFVFLGMVTSVAAAFLRSLRWRLLMKPFDPDMKVITAFDGVNIGYLANFIFPRIGEIVRCGFVSRDSARRRAVSTDGSKAQGISFEQAVGTVLLSRTWDIIVIFILIGVLLAFRWGRFGAFFTESIMIPVEQKLNLSIWWVVAIAALLCCAALFVIYRLRGRSRICSKVCGFCNGIVQGFVGFRKMRGKGMFLIYTVGMWLLYWLMSMCILWAMPQITGLDGIDGWFLCLAGSVAWIVPVPGGFGAYHYIVALAVSSIYGFSWEVGMLYAVLNHEAQAIVMVICGIVSYSVEVLRTGGRSSSGGKKIENLQDRI